MEWVRYFRDGLFFQKQFFFGDSFPLQVSTKLLVLVDTDGKFPTAHPTLPCPAQHFFDDQFYIVLFVHSDRHASTHWFPPPLLSTPLQVNYNNLT